MPSTKVSIEFLDGSDSGIISKCTRIIKSMHDNPLYKLAPISPQGIETAIKHLHDMSQKAKKGGQHNIDNCTEARGDVDDYIRQTADYLNHRSFNREELETTGFDLVEGARKQKVGKDVFENFM